MGAEPQDIVLECRQVGHWFGAKRVLQNVNLRIARGQIVALVGPSGCGKSTLLRAILGTHPPRTGEVQMDGVSYRAPHRNRGIVYQRYSLFPFLTAEENVAFGPMLDQTNWPFRWLQCWKWWPLRRKHVQEAGEFLDRVNLGAARKQYPDELSGGMCQRVAIAQALIMRPKLLLLDEPFGALDEATREDMQLMLLQLREQNLDAQRLGDPPPHTILIVTHDLREAIYVSDRVIGLSQFHTDGQAGATIVYDKSAPAFRPTDPKDFTQFVAQKEELLHAVFDEKHIKHYAKFVSYWEDLERKQAAALK